MDRVKCPSENCKTINRGQVLLRDRARVRELQKQERRRRLAKLEVLELFHWQTSKGDRCSCRNRIGFVRSIHPEVSAGIGFRLSRELPILALSVISTQVLRQQVQNQFS